MNLTNDIKIFGGIILATIVLIVGAIFIFGKETGETLSSTSKRVEVSSDILAHDDSWSEGSPSAKVTLVEFGDFECPTCKVYEPIVQEVRTKYKDKIRFVYRHFPITQAHKYAFDAALAAEAAGKQGKFWQYHNKLFEISPNLAKNKLVENAKELSLDVDKFNQDMNSDEARQRVLNDQADANRAGVGGTPTFYINGISYDLGQLRDASDFSSKIDPLLK